MTKVIVAVQAVSPFTDAVPIALPMREPSFCIWISSRSVSPGVTMRGVLQVEALAQARAVYVARTEGMGGRLGVFAKIESC
ncbi:MAG: hypothetical protein ACKOC3_03420, partial [Candidatus Limnocylindrus sp.]